MKTDFLFTIIAMAIFRLSSPESSYTESLFLDGNGKITWGILSVDQKQKGLWFYVYNVILLTKCSVSQPFKAMAHLEARGNITAHLGNICKGYSQK